MMPKLAHAFGCECPVCYKERYYPLKGDAEMVKDETWKPKLASHAVECECEGCKRSIRHEMLHKQDCDCLNCKYPIVGGVQTQMPDYGKIALIIAKLVQEKQAAYGDSFGRSGKIIEILYPHGVQPKDYTNFLTVVRVIDKLFRIATDENALGEDPWKDAMGYCLLSVARNERNKE